MVPNKHSSVSLAHTPSYGTSVLNRVCTEGRVQTHDRIQKAAWGKTSWKNTMEACALSQCLKDPHARTYLHKKNLLIRTGENFRTIFPIVMIQINLLLNLMFSRLFIILNLQPCFSKQKSESQVTLELTFFLDYILSRPCTLWNNEEHFCCSPNPGPCSLDLILPNHIMSRTLSNQKHTFLQTFFQPQCAQTISSSDLTFSKASKMFSKTHELNNLQDLCSETMLSRTHRLQIPYPPKSTNSRTGSLSMIKVC